MQVSWPLFALLFNAQFLAILFTFAKPKAFFSFILYKSELLQIGTILVVVVVDFCEICGPLKGLVYLYSFAEFDILISLAIFVSLFLS